MDFEDETPVFHAYGGVEIDEGEPDRRRALMRLRSVSEAFIDATLKGNKAVRYPIGFKQTKD